MQTEATNLIEENTAIVGVHAKSATTKLEIRSQLVVGADGRESIIREKAKLKVQNFGTPIDVLWFRISRNSNDSHEPFARIVAGRLMMMIARSDYWQCGFVIEKGSFDHIRQLGLPWFRSELLRLAPFLDERIYQISNFEDLKLLSVRIDRLSRWHRPGLICIGDAAHAMSPIGGVGINLAIQDAVATANILVPAFRKGGVSENHLVAIQKRRMWPTIATQRIQLYIQRRLIGSILQEHSTSKLPLPLKLFKYFPVLRRISAYFIGLGIRPEQVKIKWHETSLNN